MSLTIYETADDVDFKPSRPAEGRETGSDARLIWEDDVENGTKLPYGRLSLVFMHILLAIWMKHLSLSKVKHFVAWITPNL